MKLQRVLLISLPTFIVLFTLLAEEKVVAQGSDPLFELPVQLIGFPVIVLSVRLAQFAKKLGYSLSPSTYKERSKRDTEEFAPRALDALLAQKEIIKEFGPDACIFEEPCKLHASRPGPRGEQPNWNEILQNYKVQSTGMKQWYLLSVFLGDVIRDVPLCKQLAKHLDCSRGNKPFTRD